MSVKILPSERPDESAAEGSASEDSAETAFQERRPSVPGYSHFRAVHVYELATDREPHRRIRTALSLDSPVDEPAPKYVVLQAMVYEGGQLIKSGRREPYTQGDWPSLFARHLAFKKKKDLAEVGDLLQTPGLREDGELMQYRKDLDAEIHIAAELEQRNKQAAASAKVRKRGKRR